MGGSIGNIVQGALGPAGGLIGLGGGGGGGFGNLGNLAGGYSIFGGYGLGNLFGGGGGGGAGGGNYTGLGLPPSSLGQFAGLLPLSGSVAKQQGLVGSQGAQFMNLFQEGKVGQLSDFLSSMQLQQALLPMANQANMDMLGQLAPGQISTYNNILGQAGQAAQSNPLYSQFYANQNLGMQKAAEGFQTADMLKGLLNQGMIENFQKLSSGQLPEGIANSLQQSYLGSAAKLGVGGPAVAQSVGQEYGSTLELLKQDLAGKQGGLIAQSVNTMLGAQQSAFANLFGSQQNFQTPGLQYLLSNVGLPTTGFEPMGANFFQQGISSMFSQNQANNAAEKAGQQSLWGSGIGALGNIIGLAALCWVADEIYGKGHPRAQFARLYANTHDTPFLRMYAKHGKSWAAWLNKNDWAIPMVRPIWDRMAKLGEMQFYREFGRVA